MSRIGKLPIQVPAGVTVTIKDNVVAVKGPKGELTQVINPDIMIQRKFEEFVAQVDKSKVAVQKSLEKTQLLFDSLMQKYFG